MNFIESTNFFLRTIMFDFVNKDEDMHLKFRLAPMIHIGSKAYYKCVFDNIKNCDEIYYEGLRLSNNKENLFNRWSLKNLNLRSYQLHLLAKRLGLVTQSEYFDLSNLKEKLTLTDYDPESGLIAWKKLSFKERLKVNFIDPLKLFLFQQGITREILAKNFMTSAEEADLAYGPVEDEAGTARNFIMNEREQLVFQRIEKAIHSEGSSNKIIGIIYGAGHMNSIARYLIDHFNYIPRNGKFLRVFNVK